MIAGTPTPVADILGFEDTFKGVKKLSTLYEALDGVCQLAQLIDETRTNATEIVQGGGRCYSRLKTFFRLIDYDSRLNAWL